MKRILAICLAAAALSANAAVTGTMNTDTNMNATTDTGINTTVPDNGDSSVTNSATTDPVVGDDTMNTDANDNGTISTDANTSVDARSSAFPEANFAIEFAVTGANKIISHHLDNDM